MWTLHEEKLPNWENVVKRAQEIGRTNILSITIEHKFLWKKYYVIIYWQWR